MLRNKRGQFFAIYLVLLTLFMCGMAVWLYYMQSKNIGNSMVSPISLLSLQDSQEIFNIQEKNIILSVAKESGLTDNLNLDVFNAKFIEFVMKPEQEDFRNFIFSNMTLDGKFITDATVASSDARKAVLETKGIYLFSAENNILKVERKHLGKYIVLRASNKKEANFMTFIDYDYSRSYSISFDEINKFGVNGKNSLLTLIISHSGVGYTQDSNYQYFMNNWGNSDIFLSAEESSDFGKGFDRIIESAFVSDAVKVAINKDTDKVYEREIKPEDKTDSSIKIQISNEIKQKMEENLI